MTHPNDHDHLRSADTLESLRDRLGRDALSTDEWVALTRAASYLRVDVQRSVDAASGERPDKLREVLEELEKSASHVVAAMDKYNEKHGTFIGGPPFFKLGRSIAKARAALKDGESKP